MAACILLCTLSGSLQAGNRPKIFSDSPFVYLNNNTKMSDTIQNCTLQLDENYEHGSLPYYENCVML